LLCIKKYDKKIGWCPPNNDSGQIFVPARLWMERDKNTLVPLIYDKCEGFLKFIDKYFSHAVGNHLFAKWSKLN
jgi:hypothetical protein